MKKTYLSRLFPSVEENTLAIPYFNFTETTETNVDELRIGIRYSDSTQYKTKSLPSYPLYRPTTIVAYPILKQVIQQKCLDDEVLF